MQIARLLMFCLFALISIGCASGQKVDTHQLKSEILEDERTVQVWLPKEYEAGKKYAIIYVFDAEYLFNVTCAVAEFEMVYEKIPPSIVVGVHFKKGQRNFDMGINWDGDGQLNRNGKNFYQYVKSELIPFVRKTYSTSGHSTIIGHSNSSTFANYFLFDEEKPVFDNYIALSQVFLGNTKRDFSRLFARKPERVHYYFVGIAQKDSANRIDNPLATETLLSTLQKPVSFNHRFELFKSAGHGTVFIRGLPAALEYVFQDYPSLSNQWTFDSEQGTFIHQDTKQNIAEFFDQQKLDPLDYLIKERKKASGIFGLDLRPMESDMSFVSSYGILKEDVEYLDRVIGYFEKAYPDNELILQWAGQHYRSIEAWGKAEEYFWKFNELPSVKGKHAYAYNYLFYTFDRFKKDPVKAWDLLAKYELAFPNAKYVDRWFGKISVDYRYKMEQGEIALLRYLGNSEDNENSQAIGNLLLGKLYKLQGKKNAARERLELVLKLNPESEDAKKEIDELNSDD